MFRFLPQTKWHNGRGWDFQIWRLASQAQYGGSPLSLKQARSVFDKLTCPKTWHLFTEERGGSLHCQQDHLTLANEVIGDWLDETLESKRSN